MNLEHLLAEEDLRWSRSFEMLRRAKYKRGLPLRINQGGN